MPYYGMRKSILLSGLFLLATANAQSAEFEAQAGQAGAEAAAAIVKLKDAAATSWARAEMRASIGAVSASDESVVLSCQPDDKAWTAFTYRVNYATGLVEEISSDGSVYMTFTADVSANAIVWSKEWISKHGENMLRAGNINRLSGVGQITVTGLNGDRVGLAVTCRRATQKF